MNNQMPQWLKDWVLNGNPVVTIVSKEVLRKYGLKENENSGSLEAVNNKKQN